MQGTPAEGTGAAGPNVDAEGVVQVIARAIVRSFDMGPGFQGNRALCESESVLREGLTEAGVSYDDATLSAALTMLETASLPDSNARLVRGYELHRRNRSTFSPARPLPARTMMLDRVHPFDPTEYSAADIEPYLVPSSAGDSSQSDVGAEQSNAQVMRMVPS